jgi:FeS assembly SUF system protein
VNDGSIPEYPFMNEPFRSPPGSQTPAPPAGAGEPPAPSPTPAAPPPRLGPIDPNEFEDSFTPEATALKQKVVEALKTCYDPEIPVDIYELGLIYDLRVCEDSRVYVAMTLTSPACPVAGSLPPEVESKVRAVEGVKDATVNVVWDPPWDPSRMSEAARLQLNFF